MHLFSKDTADPCSGDQYNATYQMAINETTGQTLLPNLKDPTSRVFYVDASNMLAAWFLVFYDTNGLKTFGNADNDLKQSLPDAYAYLTCYILANTPSCSDQVTSYGLAQVAGGYVSTTPDVSLLQRQTNVNLNKLQTAEGKQLYQTLANYMTLSFECGIDYHALTQSAQNELMSIAPNTFSYIQCTAFI